jgi:mannose-6-phosphate isomerase-like protein (cupin superfamily)
MRQILLGQGPDGRSTIVSEVAIGEIPSGPSYNMMTLWETTEVPPQVPDITRPSPYQYELDMAPGTVRWWHISYGPGFEADYHSTNTVDILVLLKGQVELRVQNGSVDLEEGDCVVNPGVVHGWRAGPEGCILSGMVIGLDRP